MKDNICKKKKNKLGIKRTGFIIAFLTPTIIAFCIFYLYPIITVFVTSFCKWDYSNITSPEFFGFQDLWNNYEYINDNALTVNISRLRSKLLLAGCKDAIITRKGQGYILK